MSQISYKPLPYALNALEPLISERTLSFHYGKHHKTYVDKLNDAIQGTQFASMSLEEIIQASAGKKEQVFIFNNAAQVWNHEFYWESMKPQGGGQPSSAVQRLIEGNFGSLEGFIQSFKQAGAKQFGSGWTWLVESNSKLEIMSTANADLPLVHNKKALLVVDVWEHAYYLDYQNKRPDYLSEFTNKLLNWDFVDRNLSK